jgi:hypothetical protein
MFSTKILAILAIIMVAVFSPALISQAAEPPSVGTASIEDDKASGDSVVVALSGISPGTYTVALVSANDAESLGIGSADVTVPVIQGVTQSTGELNITFDSNSDGYDGSDLLSAYSRITISGSDGLIAYSDALPSSATAEINAAIADGAALNKELDAAISAAKEAQSASDKATIDQKMGSAFVNISGINAFADSMDARAKAAVAAAPDEAGIGAAASKISEMVSNIKAWANVASATATNDVATNSSVAVQKIFVDSIVNQLNAARNGYDADGSGSIADVVTDASDPDLPVVTSTGAGEGGGAQAYTAARDMANFSLTASPLPAAEVTETEEVVEEPEATTHILDLGLPSVGERILASFMQISMVVGLGFVGFGGLLFAKSRRQ